MDRHLENYWDFDRLNGLSVSNLPSEVECFTAILKIYALNQFVHPILHYKLWARRIPLLVHWQLHQYISLAAWRQSIEITIKCFCWPHDLNLWPMTLTYKLDLVIHPLDLHAKIQVCMFVRSARRVRRTHRHTHTDDVKTITLDTSQRWGVNMHSVNCHYGPLTSSLSFTIPKHDIIGQ